MNPGLDVIQKFVQQVVEAIAAAISVEVMVFDLARNIVAGTGETKVEVGSRYNPGSLTGRLMASGQPLVARKPGKCPECVPCANYGTCPHFLVVAYPIKFDGEIKGSFCLVATDEAQRQRVLANEENLLRFLNQMCLLIGSAIGEQKIQNEMGVLLKRYNSVVNSVHEGIIATDDSGRIIHFNLSAANLLDIQPDQVLGKQLTKLIPDLSAVKAQGQNKILETEICYRRNGKKRDFLATVVPVLSKDNGMTQGVTISLKKLSEVQSYATKLMGDYNKYNFNDILGISAGINQVKEKLNKAALTDSTILIRGESGTGKELFAHSVHSASHRFQEAFVAINCGAIPESLLESELFGYEEGAFTGAKKGGKPGKFELADGGILFLDEIGDMPQHLQSKLLRVLENRSIERVGGTELIPINVRIIAATNRNLEEMVERHEFRGDLYYRLSVIPVFIPPLRKRKEDIPVLVEHFLNKYSKKLSRERQKLDDQAIARLIGYNWPGNVREMQNAIEYAINMSEPGQIITVEHLPQRITSALEAVPGTYVQPRKARLKEKAYSWNEEKAGSRGKKAGGLRTQNTLGKGQRQASTCQDADRARSENYPLNLKNLEAKAIREVLNRFGVSTAGKEKAARYLGISLATLYRRLKAIDKNGL